MALEEYLMRKQFFSILFSTKVVFDEKSNISLYELASFVELVNELKFKFCIDQNMKNNLFNFLDQIRFKDDYKNGLKNVCINALIASANLSNDYRILDFYRQELFKRTNEKKSFFLSSQVIYENIENLKTSICLDYIILNSHLLNISDEEFKERYVDLLIDSDVYIESINCILFEYPKIFQNEVFNRRVNLILDEFKNRYCSRETYKFAKKTLKKIKEISVF